MTSGPLDPRGSADSAATDWVVGARLVDIVQLLLLIKRDLDRRGISFTWSITQAAPTRADASGVARERTTGA